MNVPTWFTVANVLLTAIVATSARPVVRLDVSMSDRVSLGHQHEEVVRYLDEVIAVLRERA